MSVELLCRAVLHRVPLNESKPITKANQSSLHDVDCLWLGGDSIQNKGTTYTP